MTDIGPENSTEDELSAFVDGELDAAARARVSTRVDTDSEAAAMAQTFEHQKSMLHALFDPVLQEPVPQNLVPPEPRPMASMLVKIAAAAAYLLIGGVAGWWLHDRTAGTPEAIADLPEGAVSAHAVYSPEVRHPVEVTRRSASAPGEVVDEKARGERAGPGAHNGGIRAGWRQAAAGRQGTGSALHVSGSQR